MGVQTQTPTHDQPRYLMEVSGHLHALATFTSEKRGPVTVYMVVLMDSRTSAVKSLASNITLRKLWLLILPLRSIKYYHEHE